MTPGFSSLAAGLNVPGLSAKEVAAIYTPLPEGDSPKKKTLERKNLGKLDTRELEIAYILVVVWLLCMMRSPSAMHINLVPIWSSFRMMITLETNGCSIMFILQGRREMRRLSEDVSNVSNEDEVFKYIPLENLRNMTNSRLHWRSVSRRMEFCTKRNRYCLVLRLISLLTCNNSWCTRLT